MCVRVCVLGAAGRGEGEVDSGVGMHGCREGHDLTGSSTGLCMRITLQQGFLSPTPTTSPAPLQPTPPARPVFEWSNAMLVVLAEQLLDLDCATAAEEEQLRATVRREWDPASGQDGGIVPSLLQYYRLPEAGIPHQP